MEDNDRSRILGMLRDGKITVEEADSLLSALGPNEAPAEAVPMKDTRGRKPRKLRVMVDAAGDGSKQDAKVNISIPISLLRSVGPVVIRNMPREAKQKLDESGVDLDQIFADVEGFMESGMEEDFVNIDAGEDGKKAKVRIYVE